MFHEERKAWQGMQPKELRHRPHLASVHAPQVVSLPCPQSVAKYLSKGKAGQEGIQEEVQVARARRMKSRRRSEGEDVEKQRCKSAGRRHCVRAAKEMGSKSIGLCPQGFKSPRCRLRGRREATENSCVQYLCAHLRLIWFQYLYFPRGHSLSTTSCVHHLASISKLPPGAPQQLLVFFWLHI